MISELSSTKESNKGQLGSNTFNRVNGLGHMCTMKVADMKLSVCYLKLLAQEESETLKENQSCA